jgi:O-antigen/teichoic acid export membrane protein
MIESRSSAPEQPVQVYSRTEPQPAPRLTQRAYLNAVAALLDYASDLGVSFIVTPILIAGLGNTFFGVWQILDRLVDYMSAADGRPTQALKWVIANNQTTDDHAVNRRAIGSAIGVWFLFLPVLTVVGAIIVWLSPAITKVAPDAYPLVRITCALLALNFLLAGLATLAESVLRGMNQGYRRMGLMAGLHVVSGLLMAGAIYFGFGLIGVAASQLVVTVLTGLLFWLVVRKYITWFGIERPTMPEVWRFLRFSGWFFGWTLVNRILLASDVVILGFILSASVVTVFSVTGFPAQTIVSVIALVVGAITPGLGGIIGQKQFQKAIVVRNEIMAYSWLLATSIGTTILLWNRSFINLWVGDEQYGGAYINLLIVLISVQLIFIRNDAFIIDLTLNLSRKVILGAVAALISVVLAVILTASMGMIGICLGLIGGRLILTVSYPIIVNSFLGISKKTQLVHLLRPCLIMILMFALSSYISEYIIVKSWVAWFIYVSLTFGAASLIGFVVGLSRTQRSQLLTRVKMIQFFAGA